MGHLKLVLVDGSLEAAVKQLHTPTQRALQHAETGGLTTARQEKYSTQYCTYYIHAFRQVSN